MGSFLVSKTTNLSENPDYNMDASSGDGISWRNVQGSALVDVAQIEVNDTQTELQPPALADSSYNTLAAGVYDIQVISTPAIIGGMGEDLFVNLRITSGSPSNKLSPSVDPLDVIVSASSFDWQYPVIPGIKLKLRPYTDLGGISQYDRFQIIVGGRWLQEEDRNLEDLMFGLVSANGADSPGTKLTIKNNSGVTLTNVRAQIVNKISVYQPQIQLDFWDTVYSIQKESPYCYSTSGGTPYGWHDKDGNFYYYPPALNKYCDYNPALHHGILYQTHPLDLIVPTSGGNLKGTWVAGTIYNINDIVIWNGYHWIDAQSADTMQTDYDARPDDDWSPGSSQGSIFWHQLSSLEVHNNPQIKTFSPSIANFGDFTYFPFQRDVIFLPNVYWEGFINQTDYSSGGIPPYPFYNFLRYDFGKGNFVLANVLGISGNPACYLNITGTGQYIYYSGLDSICSLWGSQDDFDNPENWDKLMELEAANWGQMSMDTVNPGGYLKYTPFVNNKSYRHYAIVQEKSSVALAHGVNWWMSPMIQVMELISYPDASLVLDRSRPFELIDQASMTNPLFEPEAYPKKIRFDNLSNGSADLTIDGESWDLNEFYMSEEIS